MDVQSHPLGSRILFYLIRHLQSRSSFQSHPRLLTVARKRGCNNIFGPASLEARSSLRRFQIESDNSESTNYR